MISKLAGFFYQMRGTFNHLEVMDQVINQMDELKVLDQVIRNLGGGT